MRSRGLYTIIEQASRIYGQNLLTTFFLLEPPRMKTPLCGPTMGFESSRAALHYGYSSTKEWLDAKGMPLLERLLPDHGAARSHARIQPPKPAMVAEGELSRSA